VATRRGVGWYVVAVLTLAYILAYVDRQILSLLVEPIKSDLHISDAQIGMLQGVAFGIFYTIAGIPLGFAADRISRGLILTLSVGTWSLMTAACGLASTYSGLLAARVGVSSGEAALGPSAVPLIRDVIPKAQLARATAIYMLGIPLGSGLAVLLGAWLLPTLSAIGTVHWPLVGALHPWQMTFFAVALPGVVITALMTTIRDPRRQRAVTARPVAPPGAVFAYLGQHWRTFVGFGLPGIAATALTFGIGFWIPATFARSYGLSGAQVGHYLRIWGLMSLTLGSIGALTAGVVADRVRRRLQDGYLRMAVVAIAIMALSYGTFSLAPRPGLALLILAPGALFGIVPPIMAAAAQIELSPPEMRSLIAAMWSPIFTLIGIGFGPAIVAAANMMLFHSEQMLRYTIPVVAFCLSSVALTLLVLVRKSYCRTVTEAESRQPETLPQPALAAVNLQGNQEAL
jgi:MFS family permease